MIHVVESHKICYNNGCDCVIYDSKCVLWRTDMEKTGNRRSKMAAKKVYAVKKGRITGILNTWEECKAAVDGFPGAQYKSFKTREEAEEYLRSDMRDSYTDNKNAAQDFPDTPDKLVAYVDGSYQHSLQKYAFGCIFLLSDGRIYTIGGNGNQPESLKQRNVTGEMLGAMFATRFAIVNGFRAIEICYDYQGIEKWVTGEWKSKTDLTSKYAQAMRNFSTKIAISFTKVEAHTNVYYNELADKVAKEALTGASGIPETPKLQDMIPWTED